MDTAETSGQLVTKLPSRDQFPHWEDNDWLPLAGRTYRQFCDMALKLLRSERGQEAEELWVDVVLYEVEHGLGPPTATATALYEALLRNRGLWDESKPVSGAT